MQDDVELPVRLAIRKEGKTVNAYLAKAGTMEDAILMCSISVRLIENDDIFVSWKALMVKCASLVVEDVYGVRPTKMILRPAPEHERSGEA